MIPAIRRYYDTTYLELGPRVRLAVFEEDVAVIDGTFPDLLARRFRKGVKDNVQQAADLRAEALVAVAHERASDCAHRHVM